MSGVYYQLQKLECVCLLRAVVQGVGVTANICKRMSGRVRCILLDAENGVCLLLRAAVKGVGVSANRCKRESGCICQQYRK